MGQAWCRWWRAAFVVAALQGCCLPAIGADAEREQRFREYDARRNATLEQMSQRNDLLGAMARLYLNKDVEAANRIVMEANLGHWLEHIPQLALYEMFNADTGHRAKLLSREATDKLHSHMWECFQPKHGKPPYGNCRHAPVYPERPMIYWGNQNHGFVYQSWFAAAAKALGGNPKYTAQFDPDTHIGKDPDHKGTPTLAAYADDLDQQWRNRFPWMAGQGVWAEDAIYRCYSVASTYNLAYHAKDPRISKRAELLLDLHWLIHALHMVDSQLGGAMNRFKIQYQRLHYDRALGEYYFGGPGGGFHSTEVALFGDYLPPRIAYDLLADPKKRGCFAYRERLNQFSGDGQPPRTSKFSYVTPEYVLGSYVAHDLDQGPGRYHERAFNGITFGKSRAILRLGPPVSFQSYHCMQNGPILLAQWYGEPQPTAELITREDGGVPIKPLVVEGGWVFGEAADAYFALRSARGECTVKEGVVTFPEKKTPLVVHAGGVTEDGSFDAFKKKVLSNRLTYDEKNGVVAYEDARWGTSEFCTQPKASDREKVEEFPAVRAKFLRFTISSVAGSTQPCIDELEVFATDGTNVARTAKATASSTLSGYEEHKIEHVNDGQFGNARSWISNESGGGWVQLEFVEPAEINRIAWSRDRSPMPQHHDRQVKGYEVAVSDDGTTWKTVAAAGGPGDPSYAIDQWRRINGKPIDVAGKVFDSPYLSSDYDSGIVTAQFNGRKLVLDFKKGERREE